MVIAILVVLGICFGSFVNAFVWRFHEQAELRAKYADKPAQLKPALEAVSISKGRSMCVHCRHELAPKDLIPIISYLSLAGKCRYCRKPIQDTPLAELITPLLFVASYIWWPAALSGVGLFIFCAWLVFLVGFVMLSLYDLRWYELPHAIVFPLIGLALLQTIIVATVYGGGVSTLLHAGLGALIGGGIFFLIYVVSPKRRLDDGTDVSAWIGGGDITLGVLLGLLVGGPGQALLLIFTASLIGTAVAVPLLLTGKASRTSHLPFGPFLMAGAVIVKLFGTSLIAWYAGQFLF